MNRTILVPIDISDSELTQRVISHVEAEAKIDDAEVHFLTVIPSLPYYASLGLAYSAELPAMDDLKAEAKSQLEEIIKKFKLPTDRVHVHVEEGSPKDRILDGAQLLSDSGLPLIGCVMNCVKRGASGSSYSYYGYGYGAYYQNYGQDAVQD